MSATDGELVLSSCAHVGLGVGPWLAERGLHTHVFDWRDPLTEGPIPLRLDAIGMAVRGAFWNQPAEPSIGEEELLIHLARAPIEAVVVWGPEGAPTDLARAWVRSVVERELGLPVLRAHIHGIAQRSLEERVEIPSPTEVELERRVWEAVTAPGPEELVALLTGPPWCRRSAVALLRWIPRSDTGLTYWQHEFLEGAAPGQTRTIRLIAEIIGSHEPWDIGDLTLAEELAGLTALGAIHVDNPNWRTSSTELTSLGASFREGRASVPPRAHQVGGIEIVTESGAWTVEDHLRFHATREKQPRGSS